MTRLNVAGLLREPAGTSRTVELGSLDVTAGGEALPRRVLGTVRLQRTNRGIVATGRARTVARRSCIRCLDEFDEPVDVVLSDEFLPSVDPGTGRPCRSLTWTPRWRASTPIMKSTSRRSWPTSWHLPSPCIRCVARTAADSARSAVGASTMVLATTVPLDVDPRLAALADWKPPAD